MRGSVRGAFVALALPLSACAIHPLPEDVTSQTTYHIVQKVRCEALDAVIKLAVAALRESDSPATLALADQVESGELRLTDLFDDPKLRRLVDPEVHRNFDVFALSAVGLAFTFTITEGNDSSGSAFFRLPVTDGLFTLSVGAGKALDRQNERKLTTAHTFLELYELTDPKVCSRIEAKAGNVIYPITGKVGLEEVFKTFYYLNRPPNNRLRPIPDEAFKNRGVGRDVIDFSDTLTFTTAFNASATPTIRLDPISARQFRLADASANFAASREDIHKLRVTVEIGKTVDSLQHARGLIGLRAALPAAAQAKSRAVQRIYELRQEDFFTGIRQERQRLGLPPL